MLRRQHHVGGAIDRVRARGENANGAFVAFHFPGAELELRTFRAPYPVALSSLGGLRPIDVIEVRQQPRRVVANAEEPLLQQPLLDLGLAPLAESAGRSEEHTSALQSRSDI